MFKEYAERTIPQDTYAPRIAVNPVDSLVDRIARQVGDNLLDAFAHALMQIPGEDQHESVEEVCEAITRYWDVNEQRLSDLGRTHLKQLMNLNVYSWAKDLYQAFIEHAVTAAAMGEVENHNLER